MMSTRWAGVRTTPGAGMPSGQWTMSGVEMPPSCTHPLKRRNGVLEAFAQQMS